MNRGIEDAEPRFSFAKPKWTPEQMKSVIRARKCLSRLITQEYEEKERKEEALRGKEVGDGKVRCGIL